MDFQYKPKELYQIFNFLLESQKFHGIIQFVSAETKTKFSQRLKDAVASRITNHESLITSHDYRSADPESSEALCEG